MTSFILRKIDPIFWSHVPAKAAADAGRVETPILTLLTAWLGVVLLALLTVACGYENPTAPRTTPTLAAVAASVTLSATAGAGQVLIVATVKDAAGHGMSAPVTFTTTAGTMQPETVTSGTDGLAQTKVITTAIATVTATTGAAVGHMEVTPIAVGVIPPQAPDPIPPQLPPVTPPPNPVPPTVPTSTTIPRTTTTTTAPTTTTTTTSIPTTSTTTTSVTTTSTTSTTSTTTIPALFTASGTGSNVIDMPTSVARIHIVGIYAGNSTVFIVNIGGRLVVSEAIGTGQMSTTSDGIYPTIGGVVVITAPTGLAWTFTEVR